MTSETEPPIRRILVALDGSPASLAALEAAARLARSLDAELRGVYVEESDLLRLAEAAGRVQEVDALSGRVRPLEARRLRREIRVVARRARRTFERRASAVEVTWSFERARGAVPAELRRAAASDVDLLVLGLRGHMPGRGAGSTVRALLREPGAPLMVLPRGARLGDEVYVAVEEPETERKALDLAATIARRRGTSVTVILRSGEGEARRKEAVEGRMAPHPSPGARVVPSLAPPALARLLRHEPCGLLVLSRHLVVRTEEEGIALLVEVLRCPVLVTN